MFTIKNKLFPEQAVRCEIKIKNIISFYNH